MKKNEINKLTKDQAIKNIEKPTKEEFMEKHQELL